MPHPAVDTVRLTGLRTRGGNGDEAGIRRIAIRNCARSSDGTGRRHPGPRAIVPTTCRLPRDQRNSGSTCLLRSRGRVARCSRAVEGRGHCRQGAGARGEAHAFRIGAAPYQAVRRRGRCRRCHADRIQDRVGAGGSEGWTIWLADGSIWRQADTNPIYRTPKPGLDVIVKRAALGSYIMRVGGSPGVKVKRISPYRGRARGA